MEQSDKTYTNKKLEHYRKIQKEYSEYFSYLHSIFSEKNKLYIK